MDGRRGIGDDHTGSGRRGPGAPARPEGKVFRRRRTVMTARITSLLITLLLTTFVTFDARGDDAKTGPAAGPLRVLNENPRYFADGGGKIVYLTGAHTWSNLQDIGLTDP